MRKAFKSFVCLILVGMIAFTPVMASAAKVMYILSVTNCKRVNMHANSWKGSAVIAKLKRGTKVLYLNKNVGGRCKVATAGGTVGYIYKYYLKLYGALNKNKVYKTIATTPLYKRSGNKLKYKKSIPTGRYVCVYQTVGGWSYVRDLTGTAYYVKNVYLKRAFK